MDTIDAMAPEADASDITITDEMTAAGIAAFQQFHPSEDDLEWIVGAVFDAMFRLSPQRPLVFRSGEAALCSPQFFRQLECSDR